MGGDGGVIAAKREYMRAGGSKELHDEEGKSVKQIQILRSKSCSLSQKELEDPVVACELGNLYNKEAVLGYLLDKKIPSELSHIRKMKEDVKEAKFHVSSSGARSCPLTGLDFNGMIPFVLVWSTGFVLSEKAVKEMGIYSLQEEYGPFSEDDLVKLLPLDDDLESMKERMKARKEKRMMSKKKKRSGDEKQTVRAAGGDGGGRQSNGSSKKRKYGGGTLTSVDKEVSMSLSSHNSSAVYASLFHKS